MSTSTGITHACTIRNRPVRGIGSVIGIRLRVRRRQRERPDVRPRRRDQLFDCAGDDLMHGNAHNDRIFGAAGDDVIDGGAGTDLGDGGPHRSGDTCLNVETARRCEL